jgi:hypothetical protein
MDSNTQQVSQSLSNNLYKVAQQLQLKQLQQEEGERNEEDNDDDELFHIRHWSHDTQPTFHHPIRPRHRCRLGLPTTTHQLFPNALIARLAKERHTTSRVLVVLQDNNKQGTITIHYNTIVSLPYICNQRCDSKRWCVNTITPFSPNTAYIPNSLQGSPV